MQVRGAPLIAVVGSLGLYLEIRNTVHFDPVDIRQKIDYLISSRPTAVDLRNSLNGILPILDEDSSDEEKLNKLV